MAIWSSVQYLCILLICLLLHVAVEIEEQLESGQPLSILFISLPFPGHLNPALAFADELVSRGHEVTVCTSVTNENPDKHQKAADKTGVILMTFKDNDIIIMGNLTHDETTLFNFYKAMESYYHQLSIFCAKMLEKLNPSLENGKFDIALGSEFLLGALACINSRWNLPVVMVGGTLQFLPHLEPPCPWPGLMFPSLTDNMPFLERLLCILSFPMKKMGFRSVLNPHVAVLQAYCPLLTLDFASSGPGVYYPYIVKTVIGFEFPRSLMPLVEYVGPVLTQHPVLVSEDPNLEKWLNRQPDKSVLYVSMGSKFELSKKHGKALVEGILQTNLSLLWSLKEYRQSILKDLDYDLERVFVSAWTPQFGTLGSRAIHSAILHGGYGGLMEALWHEVPVAGFPQTLEQEATVARLYHNGLGLRLDLNTFTAPNIAWCIAELSKAKYRQKLKNLKKMFFVAGGSKRAADLIESYADVGYSHLVPAHAKYKWSWIQYYNVDVWLVVVSVVMLCGLLFVNCLKYVIFSCFVRKTKKD